MVLNVLWLGFFFAAFAAALGQWLVLGDAAVFGRMVAEIFTSAKGAFEIALGLVGVLSFWLGIMKVGEKAGAVALLARAVEPLFRRLFPDVPPGHPAIGSMLLNICANLLGLDNAATPLGLKAMRELQSLNPDPDTASDAQVLFITLHASGLTLVPVSIMTYRAQLGAANPADVFLPLLLTTFTSTGAGLLALSFFQKTNLRHPVVLAWIGALGAAVAGTLGMAAHLGAEQLGRVSTLASGLVLFALVVGFLALAAVRRVAAFEAFVEGAREGFQTAVTVVPYLVAILVGIGVFRASGAMDWVVKGVAAGLGALGVGADVIPALPTALMKPFSGSGARGLMIDTLKTYGADSFPGFLSSLFQGATDTTFYLVAVYYGAVAVRRTRHTITVCLIADAAGIAAALAIAHLFFHAR